MKRTLFVALLIAVTVSTAVAQQVTCTPSSVFAAYPTVQCTFTYPKPTTYYQQVGLALEGRRFFNTMANRNGGSITATIPAPWINEPRSYEVEGQYTFPGQNPGTVATTYVEVRGIKGWINPKYVVVGVTYAPPGPSSSVTYGESTFMGTTVTTSGSFTEETSETTSASAGVSIKGIFGGKITATSSEEYSQTSNSSFSYTLSKKSATTYSTNGTQDAFYPVNHDFDWIWIWLNPILLFTVDPLDARNIRWDGFAYDANDMNGMDIYGVQVGYLNGHWGAPPKSVQDVLSRTWVDPTTQWPAGEGPGITTTDINYILTADPFTNPSYVLSSPRPSTTPDGRFTQIPYPPNPVEYQQAGPGNGSGLKTDYDTEYTDSSAVGRGTSNTTKISYGLEAQFSGGAFGILFGSSLKEAGSLTYTYTWQTTLTTTKLLTKALSVTGPPCPQTTPPCVPSYAGPGQFIVYQDNMYGTFMFYPAH